MLKYFPYVPIDWKKNIQTKAREDKENYTKRKNKVKKTIKGVERKGNYNYYNPGNPHNRNSDRGSLRHD